MTAAAAPAAGLAIVFGLANEDRSRTGGPSARRAPKTSEVVAAALVRDIVDGGLAVGGRLPDEHAMLERFGVGRESLREALRLLEVQGVVTLRRGPGGGPVVAGVDPLHLARAIALYFHLSGATYGEVVETWQVLEPSVVERLAALPARAGVRARLDRYLTGACVPDPRRGDGFHGALAHESGSRVLELLLAAVGTLVVEHVARDAGPLAEQPGLLAEHAGIVRAIEDGRPAAARAAARDHARHVGEVLVEHAGPSLQRTVEWR